MVPPPSDLGDPKTLLTEFPTLLRDTDSGVFVLDREGVVRYRNTGTYMTEQGLRPLPSLDEILKAAGLGARTP